jgi:hypothetical protein
METGRMVILFYHYFEIDSLLKWQVNNTRELNKIYIYNYV